MSEQAAALVWLVLAIYAGIGLVAAFVLLFGLKRFDEEAARAAFYIKLLWLAGLIALWPLMLPRLWGAKPAEDRS